MPDSSAPGAYGRLEDDERRTLRRSLRQARRALSPQDRMRANARLARRLAHLPIFQHARRIAFFIPFDNEPDLCALMHSAQQRGQLVFVPLLRRGHMQFVAWRRDLLLRRNRYGIPEPAGGIPLDPQRLDLVLCPLLGFDRRGTRLGYGGGYYDRCFAFLERRRLWRHPKLVGVGYALQQLERIPRTPWDVPLWAAVTERDHQRFDQQERQS